MCQDKRTKKQQENRELVKQIKLLKQHEVLPLELTNSVRILTRGPSEDDGVPREEAHPDSELESESEIGISKSRNMDAEDNCKRIQLIWDFLKITKKKRN